jgi:hypothetical protein
MSNASFFMAAALCFHFFGYEASRAASISLLAAEDTGLGSGALSISVAVGSPISAVVLFLYARSIKKNGPRFTLLVSNICCTFLLGLMSVACGFLKGFWGQSIVLLFFCFREIYVSLLSTQQWSFIASVLDIKTANYLVSFAGIVSVASAVGGCCVEMIVRLGGVRALLVMAFISCGFSFICAEIANYLATSVHELSTGMEGEQNGIDQEKSEKDEMKKGFGLGFWRKSCVLLMKHETLQFLFVEALIHQCCSNMLNMMFYDGLRTGI